MLRRLVVILLLLAAAQLNPYAQSVPKLVVIVVVDQMRADYLKTFGRHWQGGFRTLLTEGAVFDNANYAHLLTVTCAGHATIGTGTFPRTHGMISNGWWQRDTRTSPECTADAKVPAVSYGANVTTGSSPARLLAPTLADELRAQKPGARVVAVSLKSRGAITLAGQQADAIVWFDDAAATLTTSRAYAETPVPAVKRYLDANPYQRDFGKAWTLLAAPNTYVYRDAGIGERPPGGWTGLFPHVIQTPTPPAPAGRAGREGGTAGRAGGAAAAPASQTASAEGSSTPAGQTAPATGRAAAAPPVVTATQAAANWQASPYADRYMARLATTLAESFQLGKRDATDFLSISFSTLDDVGHAYGPESREVEDILRQLDVTLGEFIKALDAQVGRGNYVLGFSADHGVAPFVGHGRGARVHVEDIRDRIEETLTTAFGALQKGTYVDSGTSGVIYFAPGIFDKVKAAPAVMTAMLSAIEALPGVARVLRTDQLSVTSRDPLVRAAALSHHPERGGELFVVAEEYWLVTARATNAANHGSPYRYDTNVPLIFLGGGIKPLRTSTAATPADLAPTLAQLAGVKMPKAEGRPLRDVRR
jgi:arylsulfatase A-like enzyme